MTIKTKVKNSDKPRQQLLLIGIIAAAAVAALAAIVISGSGLGRATITLDYSAIPQSRAADGGFILGDPAAPVTLLTFEDFLCPHCQNYEPTINQAIQELVVTGKAKYEFRILRTQPNSTIAATAAECAEELRPGNGFWQARDVLFHIASSEYFDTRSARKFAEQMGLDYAQLLECSSDAKQYVADGAYASELGVTGTPAIFIQVGDSRPQRIPGLPSVDDLKKFVEAAQIVQP